MSILRNKSIEEDDPSSGNSNTEDDSRPVLKFNEDIITKADIAELFKPVSIDPLILTNKKVKRTRESFQEAISALNRNMFAIDQNLRQLLAMIKEHT